jgi:hypothetical protein
VSSSLTAMSRGVCPGSAPLANSSKSAIRETLTPGAPISPMVVADSPERLTVTVMLSIERLTATASKPILRAITSIHSRVRAAVFPERSIEAPNRSSTSTASESTGLGI